MPFRSLIDYLQQGSTLAEFLEDFPSKTSSGRERTSWTLRNGAWLAARIAFPPTRRRSRMTRARKTNEQPGYRDHCR
ncbi:MAG: hypothetical protein WBP34_13420 [Thermoanaerobaculia bacterium]